MATVTLLLTDTSAGSVSMKTVFDPSIEAPCSPAQSIALSMLTEACKHLQPSTSSDTQTAQSPARPDFPRLYLCGPMSGLPDFNYPAFHHAAARLRELGYQVVNPAENGLPRSATWAQHMRADIKAMADCEAVATLPGHENSRGAKIEIELAFQLGLAIGSIELWADLVKSGHKFPPAPIRSPA